MGEDAEQCYASLGLCMCIVWSVRVRVLPNKDEACTISPHVSTGKNSRARVDFGSDTRRFGIEDSVRGVRERSSRRARAPRGGQCSVRTVT